MKNKNIRIFAMFGAVLALSLISLSMASLTNSQTTTSDILLTGKTNKDKFLFGEPVKLSFDITNTGSSPLKVSKGGFDVGNFKVYIADKTLEYRQVFGFDWGNRCTFETVNLEPNQKHQYEASNILWNGKRDGSHFSPLANAEYAKERLVTDYIFENTGEHFIKGITLDKIESKPIKITIEEPKGEDLEIWNQIKGNKEIAFLMQSNQLNTSDSNEKAKLVNQVEQIIERYPNSTYSAYLKPSLEAFKANDVKLEEFKAKIKAQAKP
jgi:hypothetical protein